MIPLRVLVVEREGEHQLADVVRNAAQTELVALATTGAQALAQTLRLRPGAVLMAANVLAPDAIATTREIMTLAPAPVIVVIDEADGTAERARASAHGAGAIATVTPPPAPHAAAYAARCSALIDTLCAVAAVPLVRRRPQRPAARTSRGGRRHGAAVIAIGASTGGPAALCGILAAMPADFEAPILVTQHISAGFTDGMVVWLNAAGPLRVKRAEHGEPLCNATVYIAADDRHLTVSADHAIALTDAPPDGGHRPSANVMFRSVAERFAAGAYAVILTGMGRDGVEGLIEVHRAGGIVCAQDEASCAVFGMPKAAIEAGVVDVVLPLAAIPKHLTDAVAGT